jgi:hypothetical protein
VQGRDKWKTSVIGCPILNMGRAVQDSAGQGRNMIIATSEPRSSSTVTSKAGEA